MSGFRIKQGRSPLSDSHHTTGDDQTHENYRPRPCRKHIHPLGMRQQRFKQHDLCTHGQSQFRLRRRQHSTELTAPHRHDGVMPDDHSQEATRSVGSCDQEQPLSARRAASLRTEFDLVPVCRPFPPPCKQQPAGSADLLRQISLLDHFRHAASPFHCTTIQSLTARLAQRDLTDSRPQAPVVEGMRADTHRCFGLDRKLPSPHICSPVSKEILIIGGILQLQMYGETE